MIDSLVGAVVDPIAQRWTPRTIGAALLFWTVGALVYVLTHPAAATCRTPSPGDGAVWCRLVALGPAGTVLTAVAGLAVLFGSAQFVAALAPALTHLLAGAYWPAGSWWAGLTRARVRRQTRIRQRLATVPPDDTTAAPWAEARIRARLRRYPGGTPPAPTRLGNVFAAMGQRVADRHGLRITACWASFVTVLPEPDRLRLTEQSTAVLGRAQAYGWALLAAGWAALLPGPVPVALWLVAVLIVVALSYLALCHSAEAYADLIEGLLAVHRLALYRAVGLPAPASTGDEPASGALLSDYLADGAAATVDLTWPPS
ncbi:hypothetical protein [Micromonospora echinofusca]|uniref:Vegetative cell wall protein gp1 n=1 Tax=Micromonospora echinofusca TaxID=47858 RepID=A0ABS3VJ69_MICEH|nr:hypothetical protein [Micromonospora echinofusca]MBO4204571.1 hypothetical protein [Micromonospora echinofusca]